MKREPEYAGLSNCVHCGLCLPACPTYIVTGDENDSPRGRLYLMHPLAERPDADPGTAIRHHLGRCLGCRACESACPAGVPYGQLLEQARFDLRRADSRRNRGASAGGRSERLDGALLTGLTGRASRVVFALLRVLRTTGLAALAGRLLPGRAGRAARLLAASAPATLPPPTSPRARPAVSPDRGDAGRAGTYALLAGCVMEGLFAHTHRATRRILAHDGWTERAAPGQACCGALHAHAGRMERARELARNNISAFERSGAQIIVTNSAGCGAAMLEYASWLAREPDWHARAEALASRTRDVMAVAAAGVAGPGRDAAEGPTPVRVAYDAPCHLLHGQPEAGAPHLVLADRTPLDIAPLPSAGECCGGAGTYNMRQPTLSDQVIATKLDEIVASGARVVTTGNPGCIMQIGACLRGAGHTLPVVHPVELLDRYLPS